MDGAQFDLYGQVHAVGVRLGRASWALARQVARSPHDVETHADFRCTCDAAVFDAFIELGGDVDTWPTFDWRRDDLLPLARRKLTAMIQGHDSIYKDFLMRNGIGPNNRGTKFGAARRNPESGFWDLWRHHGPVAEGTVESDADAHIDTEAFIQDVRQECSCVEDFALLVQVVLCERKLSEVAREWASWEGAENWKRVEDRLEKRLARLLTRLQTALARWRSVPV